MYAIRLGSIQVPCTEFFTQSGSAGTVAITALSNGWVSNHTGTGAAQIARRMYQFEAPVDARKGISLTVTTYRSGTLSDFSVTLYINGVADSSINGSSVNPANNVTNQEFTFTVGSQITKDDTISFVVSSTVDNTEIARIVSAWFDYDNKNYT